MYIHSTDFGEDFIWGVASSAYQTEGAYLEDGKGMSIWDVFTAMPGKASGHTACSFYHRYIQDIILMHYLNIKNFRFLFPGHAFFLKAMESLTKRELSFTINSLIFVWSRKLRRGSHCITGIYLFILN